MARSLVAHFGAVSNVAGYFILAYASPPSSAGRTRNAKRNYKLILAYDTSIDDDPIVALDLTTAYVARYGAWPAGSRIFVTLKLLKPTGIASPLVDASVVSS